LSKIVVAWESAKGRATKMTEIEADSEVREQAKPIRVTDFKAMRDAYQDKWWKLEPKQVPAKQYLEKISEGVERAEPKAEPLTEVLNYEEAETDVLKAVWDSAGNLKAIKSSNTIPLPHSAEELRARITLLGRAWAFVGFQQTNCDYLKGVTPQLWQEYLDYLLGEHVWGLKAKDENGLESCAPPWSLLLSYEHAVRKKAMRLVVDGMALGQAMRQAWADPVTKERYFTTPLALTAIPRKRPAVEDSGDPYKYFKGDKGKGKGKGKGKPTKGKGRAKGVTRTGIAHKTPDGRNICFKYNNKDEKCKDSKCPYLHVCGKCFQQHPAYAPECPN